jgi:hypothetical protein
MGRVESCRQSTDVMEIVDKKWRIQGAMRSVKRPKPDQTATSKEEQVSSWDLGWIYCRWKFENRFAQKGSNKRLGPASNSVARLRRSFGGTYRIRKYPGKWVGLARGQAPGPKEMSQAQLIYTRRVAKEIRR